MSWVKDILFLANTGTNTKELISHFATVKERKMDKSKSSSLAAAVAGGAAAGALMVLAVQRLNRSKGKAPTDVDVPELEGESSYSSDIGDRDENNSVENNSVGSYSDEEYEVRELDMDKLNSTVLSEKEATAEQCVRWALEEFGDRLVMSTSFGMQSAVLLHMATKVAPNIPVIWIDTGYLHKETYHFAEHLARRLSLNLKVYQSDISAARMEAFHGKLWDRDDEASHRVYGVVRKVEPMARALRELGAEAMLAGVRGKQTKHRSGLERITLNHAQKHYRIHPLLHWTQEDIDNYLAKHNLPYHPLKRLGYVSIGDKHSTKPVTKSSNSSTDKNEANDRNTRFGGKRQECGLHTERANVAELSALVSSASSLNLSFHGQQGEDRKPHGSNEGIEIYGRANCRFCKASKRVLEAKNIPYKWYTLQRYDQVNHVLEPLHCDESNSCVTRDALQHRFESAAPGLPPFEYVPQIFQNGEYVGGFTELCNEMAIPKTIMDVAILDIGGKPNMKKYNAHSWNNHTANNRVNAGVLTEDFFTAPPISHLSAPKRTVSAPVVSSKPKENNNLISKEGDKAKTDVPSPPEEKKMDA